MDDEIKKMAATLIAHDLAIFFGENMVQWAARGTGDATSKYIADNAISTAGRIIDKLLAIQVAGQLPKNTPLN